MTCFRLILSSLLQIIQLSQPQLFQMHHQNDEFFLICLTIKCRKTGKNVQRCVENEALSFKANTSCYLSFFLSQWPLETDTCRICYLHYRFTVTCDIADSCRTLTSGSHGWYPHLPSGLCSFRISAGGHIGGTLTWWGQYVRGRRHFKSWHKLCVPMKNESRQMPNR